MKDITASDPNEEVPVSVFHLVTFLVREKYSIQQVFNLGNAVIIEDHTLPQERFIQQLEEVMYHPPHKENLLQALRPRVKA